MIDRRSIANDLNAISNAVTRGECLEGIINEIAIVTENMAELSTKELKGEKTDEEQIEDL